MRKRLRRRLARILAVFATQYVLIAATTACISIWIVDTTYGVIATKFETITNALHRLH